MANRPKTRVTISVPHAAELFGVHERPSGDLLITIKRNNFHIVPDRGTVRIKEERLSVHISPCSTGHTLTRKLILEGGASQLGRYVLHYNENRLAWPLYSKRYAFLGHDIFRCASKPCDRAISIGGFDPSKNSIAVHLILTDHATKLPDRWEAWNIRCLTFNHFCLWVLWSFIPVPSLYQGDTAFPAIADDRIDSMDEWTLMAELGRANMTLSELLFERILAAVPENRYSPQILEKIIAMSSVRNSDPYYFEDRID